MDVIEVADDRCDACGAQAYVYADHPDWPTAIAYCGSHGGRFMPRLTEMGATIIDRRHELHRP